MEAVAQALAQVMSQPPAGTLPVAVAAPPVPTSTPTRRRLWAAALGGLLVLAAGGTLWWVRGPGAAPTAAQQLADLQQAEAWINEFDDADALDRAVSALERLTAQAPQSAPAAALRSLALSLRHWQRTGADPAGDLRQAGLWADKALALDHAAGLWPSVEALLGEPLRLPPDPAPLRPTGATPVPAVADDTEPDLPPPGPWARRAPARAPPASTGRCCCRHWTPTAGSSRRRPKLWASPWPRWHASCRSRARPCAAGCGPWACRGHRTMRTPMAPPTVTPTPTRWNKPPARRVHAGADTLLRGPAMKRSPLSALTVLSSLCSLGACLLLPLGARAGTWTRPRPGRPPRWPTGCSSTPRRRPA